MAEEPTRNDVIESLDKIKSIAVNSPELISENIFHGMNFLAELLIGEKKVGGAESTEGTENGLRVFMGGAMVLPQDYSEYLKNISMDKGYKLIKKKLADLDSANRTLSDIVGPRVFIDDALKGEDLKVGPFPPYLPVQVQIPKNTIVPFISYLVETLKLMATLGPIKSDLLRQIFSVSLGIFDVMNGEWRKGVLSLLGVIGQKQSIIGSIGRNFLTVWNYVSPDIQNELSDNIYDASKSLVSGFWLNMISMFSPKIVRDMIDNTLAKLKPLTQNYNNKIATIQQRAQIEAAKMGLTIQFPTIPIDNVPTADDLINMIVILRRPEVICSRELWSAIQPMLDEPVLRILLELFLIPTTEEAYQEKCNNVSDNLPKAASDAVKHGITYGKTSSSTVIPTNP